MTRWLKTYWFFVGMAIMVAVAFAFPAVGAWIKRYMILKIGIFLAFVITGLTLETSSILDQLKNVKVLVASLASSLLLFPLMAYALAGVFFPGSPDVVVGALIIGVAPVTVASGTVMTAIALGNVPLSLFICVLCNAVSILTIPFLLNLILSFGAGGGSAAIDLPLAKMLGDLVITVLIPTLIGQALRPRIKHLLPPFKKFFSIFNQCVVLLIILNAVSSSTAKLTEAGAAVFLVLGFMAGLHVLVVALNYGLSRAIGLDEASTSAFTIHTSQKTLTVSYLVWAGYFATAYPMALIPSICYHLSQMILDTFLAQRFRERAQRGLSSREAVRA